VALPPEAADPLIIPVALKSFSSSSPLPEFFLQIVRIPIDKRTPTRTPMIISKIWLLPAGSVIGTPAGISDPSFCLSSFMSGSSTGVVGSVSGDGDGVGVGLSGSSFVGSEGVSGTGFGVGSTGI